MGCIEGALRLDIDRPTRELAFEGVARAAGALPRLMAFPRDLDARAELALASLIASAVGGTAGACRGLGLSVAGRYSIPYATAVTAVAPEALSASLDACLQRYEDSDPPPPPVAEGEEQEEEGDAPRRLVDALTEMNPRSAAMRKRLNKRTKEEEGDAAHGGATDDAEMRALLVPYAAAANEAMGGGSKRGGDEGPRMRLNLDPVSVDEDAVASILRFARVAAIVRGAVEQPQQGQPQQQQQQQQQRGQGQGQQGAGELDFAALSSGAVQRDLNEFGVLLRRLRSAGEAAGAPPPCLASGFTLCDTDLAAIADIAEVDPHTIANVASLGKRDLLAVLERS